MASSARHSHHSGTSAGRYAPQNMTDDLLALIDEHLAWQNETEALERSRRDSAGTLVVDWDGTEMGHAFYRGRNSSPADIADDSSTGSSAISRATPSNASRAQPTCTASTVASSAKSKQSNPKPRIDSLFGSVISTTHPRYADTEHFRSKGPARRDSMDVNFHRDPEPDAYGHADISVAYSPTSNTARGHDPASQLNYVYNGQTMHVHERHRSQHQHGAAPHTPPLNAFFTVPVDKYRPTTHATSNGTASSSSAHIKLQQHQSLPPVLGRKKRSAKSFVKRVLSKLDSSGVLGKMRKEREEMRKTESWISGGYYA